MFVGHKARSVQLMEQILGKWKENSAVCQE
jgi:hypothetical protein